MILDRFHLAGETAAGTGIAGASRSTTTAPANSGPSVVVRPAREFARLVVCVLATVAWCISIALLAAD